MIKRLVVVLAGLLLACGGRDLGAPPISPALRIINPGINDYGVEIWDVAAGTISLSRIVPTKSDWCVKGLPDIVQLRYYNPYNQYYISPVLTLSGQAGWDFTLIDNTLTVAPVCR